MRTLMLTLGILLVACNQPAEPATETVTQTTTETAPAQPEAPAETVTEAPAQVPATPTETPPAPAEAQAPGPLPEGYTALPLLSEQPVRAFSAPPQFALQDGLDYFAVMDTSRGRMIIDLYQDETPTSVNNFVFLAQNRYYDGLAFHRVIEDFVVQGGDPNTLEPLRDMWGMGGPGYSIPLEVRRDLNFNQAGVLGMARSQDPNSGGSQFYITLAPATNLNGQYTVFGQVTEGLDVLERITRFEAQDPNTGAVNTEGTPDVMTQVRIVTRPAQP